MADSNDDILIKINLDDAGFQQSLTKAKESINGMGQSGANGIKGIADEFLNLKSTLGDIAEGGSLKSLVAGFAELSSMFIGGGIAAGLVAFAGYLSMQGEKVEAVSKEFDILARNAGLAGDSMKEAFLKSTGGILSDTEALQLANKAIVLLGSNASRMPEIMELARKSAMALGRDAGEQFEMLTRAIMSGNRRMLMRAGISLDAKKAEEEYAKAIGVTADELSQAGKEQAIANAAIEAGKTQFKDIGESITPIATEFKKVKVQFVEFGEVIFKFFNDILSPFITEFLSGIGFLTEKLKNLTAATLALLHLDFKKNTEEMSKFFGIYKEGVQELEKPIKKPAIGGADDAVDQEKVKANRAKFNKDMSAMAAAEAKDEIALAQNVTQLKKGELDARAAAEKEYQAKVQAIKSATYLNEKQKGAELVALSRQHEREKEKFEQESMQRRTKMWDNYQKHATGVLDSIARTAKKDSAQAAADIQGGAKMGQIAFDGLMQGATNAFQEIGKGAAGGSAQIEKAMLGAIASIAAQYGTMMILASLFPFDPAVMAAGIGLEVLAGALSQYGSGSSPSSSAGISSSVSSGGTSTAGAIGGSLPTDTTSVASMSPNQNKGVVVNVQGSIFDSPATGMRMVDLIRQASDNTDYAYVQIGNKPYGA